MQGRRGRQHTAFHSGPSSHVISTIAATHCVRAAGGDVPAPRHKYWDRYLSPNVGKSQPSQDSDRCAYDAEMVQQLPRPQRVHTPSEVGQRTEARPKPLAPHHGRGHLELGAQIVEQQRGGGIWARRVDAVGLDALEHGGEMVGGMDVLVQRARETSCRLGRGRCVSIFLGKNRRHIGKSQSRRPPKRTQRPPHPGAGAAAATKQTRGRPPPGLLVLGPGLLLRHNSGAITGAGKITRPGKYENVGESQPF
jgi:hypothetical protein